MDAVESFIPPVRELARAAGKRVMELLHTELVRERKADKSLVTNADHAANDIILTGLRKAFPHHRILSEETGLEGPPSAEFIWMVDPLDGTRAFARGVAGFSVMVGLLHREKPVLGVVFDPLENFLYEAAIGTGCYCWVGENRSRVRVSDRGDWEKMPVITSTDFPERLRLSLTQMIPVSFVPPLNSVGVKVGYLVRQAVDIYINHHPMNYWDSCAPLVILQEAGGRLTDWDGAPLSYPMKGSYRHFSPTLATNNHRHEELLALLKNH